MRLIAALAVSSIVLVAAIPSARGVPADDRGAVGRTPARASRDVRQRLAASTARVLASSRERVADGVTLQRLSLPGPLQVRVLRIAPTSTSSLDVAAAGAEGAYAKTSTIAEREHAVAAINGDFAVYPGYAVHPVLSDGTLRVSGYRRGPMFAAGPGGRTFVGRATPHVWAASAGHRLDVAGVNVAEPLGDGIDLYSSPGGDLVPAPRNACAARLVPLRGPSWTSRGAIKRRYQVDRNVCGAGALPFNGGVVLATSATGSQADALRSLVEGSIVRLHTSLGRPRLSEALGGMPMLVRGGNVLPRPGCQDPLCLRQPRTAVGRTANGTTLLVTVDGRSPGRSVGVTLRGLARLMTQLHAVDALNLDGGGGTTMWVHGQGVVNHPSDVAGERPVTTALVVIRGSDDPPGLRTAP